MGGGSVTQSQFTCQGRVHKQVQQELAKLVHLIKGEHGGRVRESMFQKGRKIYNSYAK